MSGLNSRRDGRRLRNLALLALWLLWPGLTVVRGNPDNSELQDYVRDEWGPRRGYPGGRIYGITQTSDGYLWVGTDRGLTRFDGSSFRVFRQSAPGNSPIGAVLGLAGDQRENLLISTQELQRMHLRNDALAQIPRLEGQPEGPVSAIYHEHNGVILIAMARRGLVAYDGKKFTPLAGMRPDITAAVQARDGTLWVGTATEGLFAQPDRQGLDKLKVLRNVKINALLPFGDRGIWVGTDKGLLRWDGKGAPEPLFGPSPVHVMLEDRQGNVWVGSTEGLFLIRAGSAGQTLVRCSRDNVISLYADREDNIWAGASTGIVRFRQKSFTTLPVDGGAEGSGGTLYADERGEMWLARRNLARIVDGRARTVTASSFTAISGAGRALWLGKADGSVWRADIGPPAARIMPEKHAQLDQPVTAIFPSRDGPLWVGTQNGGVAEIRNGRSMMHSSADGLVLNTVTAIEQAGDGVMWFATAGGAVSLSQGRWRSYTSRSGAPPGRINCMLADSHGVLWVGAERGLGYIENGEAHTPAWRLPALREPIYGIAVDRDDYLWVLTPNNVFRVKRAELLTSGAAPVSIRQFGAADGLPDLLPGRTGRSIVADSTGRIWMSLGSALVVADPVGLRQSAPPTPAQFQQVAADGLSLPLSETVSVPAGHRRTVIRFTGLNLTAPDRVRYRYRLSPFDPDWSDPTAVREATYTNLRPGSYRFEVQASNIDGLWNGLPSTILLDVQPTLFETVWFRSLLAVALFALGLTVYQLRLRAVQRQWDLRFHERLDERTRIARELHDTLLQSFHGLILRFQAAREMLPDQPAAASDALGSAIDRAADAVTEGRDAVQSLRGEEACDDLDSSLASIEREFRSEARDSRGSDAHPSYRVLVEGSPRRLHPVVRDDLYRIAREAVRNAFRHARARQIELDIRYDARVFRLRVRDDGGGIDPHVLSVGRRKGHYGLPGMRERADSIGAQLEIWSELHRGTEIEITVPAMIAYAQVETLGKGSLY